MKKLLKLLVLIFFLEGTCFSEENQFYNPQVQFYNPQVIEELKDSYKELTQFFYKVITLDEYEQVKEVFTEDIENITSKREEFKRTVWDIESFYIKLNEFNSFLQSIPSYQLSQIKHHIEINNYTPISPILYRLSITSKGCISKGYKDERLFLEFNNIYKKLSILGSKIITWNVDYLTYLFNYKYQKINFNANPIELFIKNKFTLFNKPIPKYIGVNNREPILRVSFIELFPQKFNITTTLEIGMLWNNFLTPQEYQRYKLQKKDDIFLRYLGTCLVFLPKPEDFGIGPVLYLDALKIGIIYKFKEKRAYLGLGLSKFDLIGFLSKYNIL